MLSHLPRRIRVTDPDRRTLLAGLLVQARQMRDRAILPNVALIHSVYCDAYIVAFEAMEQDEADRAEQARAMKAARAARRFAREFRRGRNHLANTQ